MNPPKPMPAFIIPTAMPLLRENPEAIRMEFGKIETAQVPSPSTAQNSIILTEADHASERVRQDPTPPCTFPPAGQTSPSICQPTTR